jgi:hypothetical protein
MKPQGTAPRRGRVVRRGTAPRHLSSHANLLHDVSTSPTPSGRSRRTRPDAIIVPATRRASALTGLIELAADLETQLVVLCSRQATIDRVAERVGRVHGARALVVQLDGYDLPLPEFETSSPEFAAANGGRASDLSLKRNFGLLLARLRGWRKIVFVDDDITLRRTDLVRVADLLDRHEFAGMTCPDFWDNSVFCHARRLAGLRQDVFVSGGVLGVNCGPLPLPFFPDVYNEDWFFFGEAAARRRLAKSGEARQAEYYPFAPARARSEEFGDLLAEGLYTRIESLGDVSSFREVVSGAKADYWSSFIDDRRHNLQNTRSRLGEFTGLFSCSDRVADAMGSLEAADALYADGISAERCVQFLEAWQADIAKWEKTYIDLCSLDSTRDAMEWFGATNWQTVG